MRKTKAARLDEQSLANERYVEECRNTYKERLLNAIIFVIRHGTIFPDGDRICARLPNSDYARLTVEYREETFSELWGLEAHIVSYQEHLNLQIEREEKLRLIKSKVESILTPEEIEIYQNPNHAEPSWTSSFE